jgi:hypothetical protein
MASTILGSAGGERLARAGEGGEGTLKGVIGARKKKGGGGRAGREEERREGGKERKERGERRREGLGREGRAFKD